MTGSWGRAATGWRMGVRVAAGDDRLGVRIGMLAARFPRFDFGTRRMRDHVAIEAVRHDKDAPGVAVVITDDVDEMRQVLQDAEDSLPGGGRNRREGRPPGGDQAGDPGG